MRLIWTRMKIIIEPSCAAPLAVANSSHFRTLDDIQRVGIILSGGNVDLDALRSASRSTLPPLRMIPTRWMSSRVRKWLEFATARGAAQLGSMMIFIRVQISRIASRTSSSVTV